MTKQDDSKGFAHMDKTQNQTKDAPPTMTQDKEDKPAKSMEEVAAK